MIGQMVRARICVYILIGILAWGACNKRNNEPEVVNREEFTGARYVRTYQVSIGDIEQVIKYSGTVICDQAMNIIPNMAGRIDLLAVQEGDQVSSNQVIAMIDQNTLTQTEANFTLAENNYRRAQNLLQQKAIDQKSYEETEVYYINMKSSFELTKENLEVKAPFSGIISQINFKVNDNYTPLLGLPLFRIINNDLVYIETNVSNLDICLLALNQKVRVQVDRQNILGYISFISPENDRITGLNRVKIGFRTPQQNLRNNQFASIEFIPEAKSEVLIIPRIALIEGEIVIKVENSRAVYTSIRTGLASRTQIEVLAGLEVGDFVVIEGVSGLENGYPVVEFEP